MLKEEADLQDKLMMLEDMIRRENKKLGKWYMKFFKRKQFKKIQTLQEKHQSVFKELRALRRISNPNDFIRSKY